MRRTCNKLVVYSSTYQKGNLFNITFIQNSIPISLGFTVFKVKKVARIHKVV